MSDSIVLTGDGVTFARLAALKAALKLEKVGMKRNGRSAKSILCERYQLTPRTAYNTVLLKVQQEMDELLEKQQKRTVLNVMANL